MSAEVSDVKAALAEFWTLPETCVPRLVRDTEVFSDGVRYRWCAAIIVRRSGGRLQQFMREDTDPAKAILEVMADYRRTEEYLRELREE